MRCRSLFRVAASPFKLVVIAVAGVVAGLVVTEMANSSSSPKADSIPAATSAAAHPGDGVCAVSMAAYHDVLENVGTASAVHSRNDALDVVMAQSPHASMGTLDAYFALFTSHSGKVPPTRMSVWVVEINGLDHPWSGGQAVSGTPATVMIHHIVFVLSDADLHTVAAYMCP
jgi:hypothetical protein